MKERSKLRLLAVFAHPDDESFGVGGTLARYAAEGVEVHLACATRGEAGGVGDPPLCAAKELGKLREEELRAASSALGVWSLRFLECVDGRLHSCPWATLVGGVVAAWLGYSVMRITELGGEGVAEIGGASDQARQLLDVRFREYAGVVQWENSPRF